MLKQITFNIVLFISMLCCFSACIKDVDFDQAEDLSISPAFEVSLIYFDAEPKNFLTALGSEMITVSDSLNINLLSEQFVVDNLTKAEFFFETNNTIKRAFKVEINLYNDIFQLQHSFSFEVGASTNNQNVSVELGKVFEEQDLDKLKSTTNIVLSFFLLPSEDGSVLNKDTSGDLKLQSKVSFYFDINSSE